MGNPEIRTAADAKLAGDSKRQMLESPAEFDGTLQELSDRYIVPNLPDPRVVEAFHRALMNHVRSSDPLFLLRHMRDTVRRETYATSAGQRMKMTDNAPAWWTQAALFRGCEVADGAMATVIETIPTHMFDVPATTPKQTANAKGWHIAHIFDVKNRDVDYASWSREEVVGRCIRNLHPCNYFLLPKTDWQQWGGDRRVIGYFAELYARRYRNVWVEFLAEGRGDLAVLLPGNPELQYTYGTESTPIPEETSPLAPMVRSRSNGAVQRYSASRFRLKASVIESLADGERVRISTPVGDFELTKEDVHRDFSSAVSSNSYLSSGYYHWPKVPAAAWPYLVGPSDK
ncbi:MAG: hypothetical protein JWO05_3865 [Gemmatimonadetes bacterium]|nr:hypothetical protein [Gemmatimonadota bacterium]